MKLDPVGTVLGVTALLGVLAIIIRTEFGARTWRKPRPPEPGPPLTGMPPAPSSTRPRVGRYAIGPPTEHIPMDRCPDCIWEYEGMPVSWPCAIHTRPRPTDDLSLWDASLAQPRVRRLRDRKDIPR